MFAAHKYFDLANISFAEIFDNTENVWEVLPKIQAYILEQFKKEALIPNFKNRTDVYIGEGTIVHESVEIIGPAIIGNNCTISHGAYLRENCLIGNNVHIGHASEIKNSILLNNSSSAHFNYVGDSILGNSVNMGAGAKTANFRFDKKAVCIKPGDQVIETGLQKLGAIIGDNSGVGINAVLNPGTILGKNTVVHPLVSVKGVHEENEVIK